MVLWVGQDGTLNDDDGDGAAAPGSADGDDTSVDAGDANAVATDQDDAGDATDVADGEEVVEVADDQPLASVYESTAIFEPSMYLPGEVVLYSGHPYFTRRYYERIGLPVRGLRAVRRPGFFERLFGRRRAVARPWTQGLVELRRLYPGRSDVELLELHRRYPGREREMLEARVHAEHRHPAHGRSGAHPHEGHSSPHGAPGEHHGHPHHQGQSQQHAAQQQPSKTPATPTPPQHGALPPKVPATPPPHATSGTFTGWDYPLTDYDGDLFIDGPGAYWVWTITEPWLPAVHPSNRIPPMWPPPWPPEMIAAAELSPEAIERSGLVYPEEQEETQIMTRGAISGFFKFA